MAQPRRTSAARIRWPELLATAGFGVSITALGGFATEFAREREARAAKACEIAAAILQDDTPNATLTEREKRQSADVALRRLVRCLRE